VIVADAPDIWYFKDTSGDGKADEQRKLYTGLGVGNVQGLANSFQWGLDNRIYLAISGSGAELKSVGDDQERPLSLRGRDTAIDPRTWRVMPVSGGAQHGLSFDDWGNRFVCSNSDHLQEVMYEDRYLARNPYIAAPSPRRSIAADGPQADVFRTSPSSRGGLSARGCGPRVSCRASSKAVAARLDILPEQQVRRSIAATLGPANWHGVAIVGDVGSNLVHRKKLEPDGVGFIGRRIDEKSEFVSSNDIWFRPVQFANAPTAHCISSICIAR